jgi:hypothetical protein
VYIQKFPIEKCILIKIFGAACENLIVSQQEKNCPAFYETRRFITVFTVTPYWIISSASIVHFTSHLISLRSILILFTHLHLGHPSGLFHSGLQQ